MELLRCEGDVVKLQAFLDAMRGDGVGGLRNFMLRGRKMRDGKWELVELRFSAADKRREYVCEQVL